jgi:hypothetical protein
MPYSTLPRRWDRNAAVIPRERGAFKTTVPTRERGNKSIRMLTPTEFSPFSHDESEA